MEKISRNHVINKSFPSYDPAQLTVWNVRNMFNATPVLDSLIKNQLNGKKFMPTCVQNEIIATVYFLYISLANKSHYLESLFVTTMKKVFF